MPADHACSILVIDDDEDIRESVVEILEDQGYPAVGAQHGGEALELLHRTNPVPCLILLDLMMPVMDGAEFRSKQLEDPAISGIPVVVISAYHDVEQKAQGLQSAGTLRKPIQLKALLSTVQKFCPKSAARPAR
jgi:CheY-like chemotaxis protein